MARGDLLAVRGLDKQIGARPILQNVSFQAETGEIVVVTGPNGAGKTTLFRILAGLLPKTAGEVLWNGAGIGPRPGELGFLAHQPMLYDTLSVLENLRFFSRMAGTWAEDWLEELLRLVDLWLFRHEPAMILSRGMQQRLALARVLCTKPRLILYDEPFTGLDLLGRQLLNSVLLAYQSQAIQLLITHEPAFLSELAYRRIELRAGRLVEGGQS